MNSAVLVTQASSSLRRILRIVAPLSQLFLLTLIFERPVKRLLGDATMFFLKPLLVLAFIAIFVWAHVHLRHLRLQGPAALLPAAIGWIVLVVVAIDPLAPALMRRDFQRNYARRMQVVGQVQSGALDATRHYLDLPRDLRDLALTGRLGALKDDEHHKTVVVFLDSMGSFGDEWSGFMYRSDEQPPRDDRCRTSTPLQPHWFWTECSGGVDEQ